MKLFLLIIYVLMILLAAVFIFLHEKEDAIIFLLYAVIFRTFQMEENKNN